MAISMLDQMLFKLPCGHAVILGRLADAKTWVCEACGKSTDLTANPYKAQLERDMDTATQIDLQAQERGDTIQRLD